MAKKLTCDNCPGICCINPPTCESIEEIEFAISKGVKLIAFPESKDNYFVMLDRKDGHCPFLNKDGKCDVYDNRFEVCKKFVCRSCDNELDFPIKPEEFDFSNVNIDPSFQGKKFSKDIVDKYNIEVEDNERRLIERIYLVSYDFYSKKIDELNKLNLEGDR